MAGSRGPRKAVSTSLPAQKKRAEDDARWKKSFRRSRSQLEILAKEALAEHRSRKTRGLCDYRAAKKAGCKAEATEPRAVSATYNARVKHLVINLRSGATFLLPINLVEGLKSATRKEIAAVEILGNGSALHWETLDIDLSVPHLLMGQFGTKAWMSRMSSQNDQAINVDIDRIKPCDCLRGLRYRENLTQKEMAVRLGITSGNLSAMERGKRPIGKDLAKKIAAIFGGSYKSFL